MDILNRLEQESGISRKRIEAAVKLLDEGNTVPFIARYRKEVTGSMDAIPSCARFRQGLNICAVWSAAEKKSAP